MKKNNIERKEGIVIETLPNTNFKVRLENGREILAHLSGKMRLHFIRILVGDKVIIELGQDSPERGRIVYRNK